MYENEMHVLSKEGSFFNERHFREVTGFLNGFFRRIGDSVSSAASGGLLKGVSEFISGSGSAQFFAAHDCEVKARALGHTQLGARRNCLLAGLPENAADHEWFKNVDWDEPAPAAFDREKWEKEKLMIPGGANTADPVTELERQYDTRRKDPKKQKSFVLMALQALEFIHNTRPYVVCPVAEVASLAGSAYGKARAVNTGVRRKVEKERARRFAGVFRDRKKDAAAREIQRRWSETQKRRRWSALISEAQREAAARKINNSSVKAKKGKETQTTKTRRLKEVPSRKKNYKPCKEHQYRNPTTNRCNRIPGDSNKKPLKDSRGSEAKEKVMLPEAVKHV